jgi:hypothetical protein
MFDPKNSPGLKKLKLILSDKYHPKMDDSAKDMRSPLSEDSGFNIEDTPTDEMKKITEFNSK